MPGERRGGLVEEDDLAVVNQGGSALDELLLGDAQLLGVNLVVKIEPHPAQVFRRLAAHGRPVEREGTGFGEGCP